MEKIKLKVENKALLDSPVWESHKRGRNWFAVIKLNPKAPNGIERKFFPKAHGEYYYIITEEAKPGVPVEFGADYYTNAGHLNPCRWYGVITEVTPDYIELIPCKSAREACKLAEQMAAAKDVVVVTRHKVLVDLLRDHGIIPDGAVVVEHATPDIVKDKVVVGILPLHLAALAKEIIAPEIDTPPDARGRELSREELEKFFRGVKRYKVVELNNEA